MKKFVFILFSLVLCGCAGHYDMPNDFEYKPITTQNHTIATWQKISDKKQPIHIYIEGDGHAFYANGLPTNNPTPSDSFLRNLASSDSHNNVVYIARPCQFIFDSNCDISDWTIARFSQDNIDSVAYVIKQIAKSRPIVLIGYSGGALMSGLIIEQNPNIRVKKWITVAGVLNHHDWTRYFGDADLDKSVDLEKMPNIPQIHYVGDRDTVVPLDLSKKWVKNDNLEVIPGASHNDFPSLEIDFK